MIDVDRVAITNRRRQPFATHLMYPITRQLSSYVIDKNLANQEAWIEYGHTLSIT